MALALHDVGRPPGAMIGSGLDRPRRPDDAERCRRRAPAEARWSRSPGGRAVKVLPSPGVLATVISPPSKPASSRLIESPRPVPP